MLFIKASSQYSSHTAHEKKNEQQMRWFFFCFPTKLAKKNTAQSFFAPKRNVCALGRLGACFYEFSFFCYSLLFMLLIPYKNRVGGRRGGVKNSSGRFVSTDLGKCVLSTWHLLRRGRVRKFLPQESGIWGVGGLNKYFFAAALYKK